MPLLENKTALVTAAGQGIGRAIAEAFAREGADVHATDLNERTLASLARDGVTTSVVDGTDARAVEQCLSAFDRLDILVNCIGYVHQGTILDCDVGHWQRSFRINVDSMYHTCRGALPGMLERGNGVIINMASAASSLKGFPNRAAYGATKAAVIGLSKSIAADFVGRGIRCNAICPGTIKSPSLEQRVEALGEKVGGVDKAWEMFVSRQPMGRLGTPEEVAAVAVYLASDAAAFTTGQTFAVDGGILT